MWLAKLFGARTLDDSEPAKFPPASGAASAQSLRRSVAAPGDRARGAQKAKGFDPYNSGVFRKASAWERVNRR